MHENVERNLADIKGSPRNPRVISRHDFDHLKQSITKFGDLSGIVRNRRTNQLVGGHQRIEAFRALKAPKVVIDETLEEPNSVGTVARGYVLLGDEKYMYREVDWAVEFEEAANVAANRIQGEWDRDALAQIMFEMDPELHDLTGQTEDEIAKLLSSVSGDSNEPESPEDDEPGYERMTFSFTTEQADVMRRAIESAKSKEKFDTQVNENSDGNAVYFMALNYLGFASVTMSEPTTTEIPGAPSNNEIAVSSTPSAIPGVASSEDEFE